MNTKSSKTFAALALTAISGASLVGCSTIAAQTTVSLEQGTYDHAHTFGDDLGQRLVVDDEGNATLSTYTCEDDAPTLAKEQQGLIEGDQLIFEGPDGKEIGRAELWQARTTDPETKLSKPVEIYDVDGSTFQPARQDSLCG